MSGGTQRLILDRLTKAIRERIDSPQVLTVTDEARWANQGTLIVRRDGSLDALMRIGYNFQDAYGDLYTDPAPSTADGASGTCTYPGDFPRLEAKDWRTFSINYTRDAERTYKAAEAFILRTIGAMVDR